MYSMLLQLTSALDWGIIIDKAPELASVIIVAWFALKMTENSRLASAKVMDEWRGWLTQMENNWQLFTKERDEQYLQSMDKMRAASDISTARLAEEIKTITHELAGMKEIIVVHDQRVIAAIPVMQRTLDEMSQERREKNAARLPTARLPKGRRPAE